MKVSHSQYENQSQCHLTYCTPKMVVFWISLSRKKGCNFQEINFNCLGFLSEELQNQGVQEVFVFLTRGELNKYRVPSLLEVYQQQGFTVHHMPFPDGGAPELEQCCQILEELQISLKNNRRTVIQ